MTFSTISEMKSFCAQHNIIPVGNKSYKATWQDAIDTYMEVQAEVIAAAVDAEIAAAESSEAIEVAIVAFGALVIAALTSDEAIKFYRGVLKFAAFTVIMAWMFASTAVKWCWENRSRAAVYHWIEDWADSQSGKSTLAHLLIAEWVVMAWVDTAVNWRDRLIQSWRDRMAVVLVRVGLT
jgi:hypothetical protein